MSAYTHHGDCSTSDPCKRCFEFGETTERRRAIKLLEGQIIILESRIKNIKGGFFGDFTIVLKTDIDNLRDYIALIKGDDE